MYVMFMYIVGGGGGCLIGEVIYMGVESVRGDIYGDIDRYEVCFFLYIV